MNATKLERAVARDLGAVHERAVRAAEVAHDDLAVAPAHERVAARGLGGRNAEVAVRAASEHELAAQLEAHGRMGRQEEQRRVAVHAGHFGARAGPLERPF